MGLTAGISINCKITLSYFSLTFMHYSIIRLT